MYMAFAAKITKTRSCIITQRFSRVLLYTEVLSVNQPIWLSESEDQTKGTIKKRWERGHGGGGREIASYNFDGSIRPQASQTRYQYCRRGSLLGIHKVGWEAAPFQRPINKSLALRVFLLQETFWCWFCKETINSSVAPKEDYPEQAWLWESLEALQSLQIPIQPH